MVLVKLLTYNKIFVFQTSMEYDEAVQKNHCYMKVLNLRSTVLAIIAFFKENHDGRDPAEELDREPSPFFRQS